MTTKIKFQNFLKVFALCALVFSFGAHDCSAAVVDRNNSRRPAASESRVPTMTARISADEKSSPQAKTSTKKTETKSSSKSETEKIDYSGEEYIIEDKTSKFEETISDVESSGLDTSASSLADKIRAQRAAADAKDKVSEATVKMQAAAATGKNACDQGLRSCMQEKCGKDYSKCAGDTDTIWGDKMDSCRRDLPCTGHEYAMFTIEIKADRDMNARIAGYNAIIECGNSYNDCIFTECGTTFEKCLGKKAGDKAIQKCEKIAKNCKQQDSGLSSRMMEAFGAVRQDAEKAIQRDEKRLYELRDAMRDTCGRLGAMFDERTLDCVYTVNFYAGEKNTLYASKKAYAGGTFNCDQNWFGVDITTFKENAFRATREQKSATSALMGSGVGMAVGAVTSGAIDRAIDRHKADKALDKAQDEHCENYPDDPQCADKKSKKKKDKEDKEEDKEDKADKGKDDKKDDEEDKEKSPAESFKETTDAANKELDEKFGDSDWYQSAKLNSAIKSEPDFNSAATMDPSKVMSASKTQPSLLTSGSFGTTAPTTTKSLFGSSTPSFSSSSSGSSSSGSSSSGSSSSGSSSNGSSSNGSSSGGSSSSGSSSGGSSTGN